MAASALTECTEFMIVSEGAGQTDVASYLVANSSALAGDAAFADTFVHGDGDATVGQTDADKKVEAALAREVAEGRAWALQPMPAGCPYNEDDEDDEGAPAPAPAPAPAAVLAIPPGVCVTRRILRMRAV